MKALNPYEVEGLRKKLNYDGVAKAAPSDLTAYQICSFMELGQEMLWRFQIYPELEEILLSVVSEPGVLREGGELHISASRFVKMRFVGCNTDLSDTSALQEFVEARLPVSLMGDGSISLRRGDPIVSAYLATNWDDVPELKVCIYRIAQELWVRLSKLYLSHSVTAI